MRSAISTILVLSVILFSVSPSLSRTTLYGYDNAGNLTTTDFQDGTRIDYSYDRIGNRLSCQVTAPHREFVLLVETSEGQALAGLTITAFSEDGSNTGINSVTGSDGTAVFNISGFPEGIYRFRINYLNQFFWSEGVALPEASETHVVISQTQVELTVMAAGKTAAGVVVTVYDETGAEVSISGMTDSDGTIRFMLPDNGKFSFGTEYMDSRYLSDTIEIIQGGTLQVTLDTGGGELVVRVQKDSGEPLPDLDLYLLTASGTDLDIHGVSDASGQVLFEVSNGDYKVTTRYLEHLFQSNNIMVISDAFLSFEIPHKDVTVTVRGNMNSDMTPKPDSAVDLYSTEASFLGKTMITDDQGQAVFNIPGVEFKMRSKYLEREYWSEPVVWNDTDIMIDEGEADVTVTGMDQPLPEVNVSVCSSLEQDLGISGTTGFDGRVQFRLPENTYRFKADYKETSYWSGPTPIISHTSNPVLISTGGGVVVLSVFKNEDEPIPAIPCSLYDASGSYLGRQGATDGNGQASFELEDGSYRISMDYLGHTFQTDVFTVPGTTDLTYWIPHETVTICVQGNYADDPAPVEGCDVCLLTSSGISPVWCGVSDSSGCTALDLPENQYIPRAEYLSSWYWADPLTWADTTIIIEEGIAQVTVNHGDKLLKNATVTVLSSSGTDLGVSEQTANDGLVSFRLPQGTYTFKGEYHGDSHQTTQELIPHEVTPVTIDTGGGEIVLTVEKEPGSPLEGIPVSLFDADGNSMEVSGITNRQGQFSFNITEGMYTVRTDYLGHTFWSETVSLPASRAITLTITHQDVSVTVQKSFDSQAEPLEEVDVSLYTDSSACDTAAGTTDSNGMAIFSLPERTFAVKADYLGSPYWSDPFIWKDQTITIAHGAVTLHLTSGDETVAKGVKAYLCDASGSFLERLNNPDDNGCIRAIIPSGTWLFMVDYKGKRHWSDGVSVPADEEVTVEMPLK